MEDCRAVSLRVGGGGIAESKEEATGEVVRGPIEPPLGATEMAEEREGAVVVVAADDEDVKRRLSLARAPSSSSTPARGGKDSKTESLVSIERTDSRGRLVLLRSGRRETTLRLRKRARPLTPPLLATRRQSSQCLSLEIRNPPREHKRRQPAAALSLHPAPHLPSSGDASPSRTSSPRSFPAQQLFVEHSGHGTCQAALLRNTPLNAPTALPSSSLQLPHSATAHAHSLRRRIRRNRLHPPL